jgi:DNA/RNA-binding domain of Phe-tRNA-synthetase-like protein
MSTDMADISALQAYLDGASVSPEIFELRPDYRVVLLAATGIQPGPSNEVSEALLQDAEQSARASMLSNPVTEIPHVAAWREAYKAFGTKPNKFRNSLEALTRRIGPESGLPRVNRLTDIYNSVSVKYQIPLGGEDLDKYVGPPRLIRATGGERFDAKEKGEIIQEHPDRGEVVWVDDAGVTCRRWNWRQTPRTALTDETTKVLFICDALGTMSDQLLDTAVNQLINEVKKLGPNVQIAIRKIAQ